MENAPSATPPPRQYCPPPPGPAWQPMTLATPDATRTHAVPVPCRETSWGQQHIAQDFDNLIGSGAPGLGFSIDFLERMHDILVMQGDIRLAQGGTVAGIKGSIPLLVL